VDAGAENGNLIADKASRAAGYLCVVDVSSFTQASSPLAEADGNRNPRRAGGSRPAGEIGLRVGRVRRSHEVAEADGNRTRPPRIARRTGFEDREGHQSPFASEARIVVSGPPCSGPQRDGRAGAGRPATPHVLVTLELEQHPLAIEARGIAA
jgi:hypothetical protein